MTKNIDLTDLEIERFWSKVDIRSEDQCWPWRNKESGEDYGIFYVYRNGCKSKYKAHRVSLFLSSGILGIQARHSCDNPICCNPNHLSWGTNQDNVDDKLARNRQSKGTDHGMAKLTPGKVLEIRAAFADGVHKKELAERYNVTTPNIRAIVNRISWKHI